MSKENNNKTQTKEKTPEAKSQTTEAKPKAAEEKQTFKVSDDLIAVFRELVQLSLLTGTNLVDHMRAVRVEVVENSVVPTEEYIEQYNSYIEELEKQAEKLQAEMQAQEASDQSVN